MRDLLLVCLLPFLSYFALKRPFIAAGLWLWTSAFNINAMLYGFASSITYNRYFAGLTIIAYLINKHKPKIRLDKLSWLILLFFFWTTMSSFLGSSNELIMWDKWVLMMKIILFYLFGIAIVDRKQHIDFFVWVLVLSIGLLAAREGAKFLVSGGGHKITSIGGISGDNNFFALLILILLPMSFYLVTQIKHKLIKQGLLFGIHLIILGVICTYSRAGFVGLAIVGLFFLKASKNKLIWTIVLILVIGTAKNYMPETWFDRMDTVEHAEQDGSFMHRVVVWKVATVMAIHNPFFGEGFKAIENINLWQKYAVDFDWLDFIPTPDVNYNEPVRAAHSIYFQVLSDHGVVGLVLFLMILLTAFFKLGAIKSRAKKLNLPQWINSLASMLQISLTVFCISGGTVSAAYFDLLYAIFIFVYVLDHRIIGEQ